MNPAILASDMMPAIESSTKNAVQKVAAAEFPAIWESLPPAVCQEIYNLASQVIQPALPCYPLPPPLLPFPPLLSLHFQLPPLPAPTPAAFYTLQDAEQFITDLMEDLRADVLNYFDLEALVVRRAKENKALVVDMFQVSPCRASSASKRQQGHCCNERLKAPAAALRGTGAPSQPAMCSIDISPNPSSAASPCRSRPATLDIP